MQDTEQVVCQLLFAAWCRKTDEKWKWIAVFGGKAAKKWPLSYLSGLTLLKLACYASFNQGVVLT
jgi:hypothetical protein